MNLKNPVLVGFGIKDKQHLKQPANMQTVLLLEHAYIKGFENETDVKEATKQIFRTKILKIERKTGLEPATYSLGSCRSTR